MKNALIITLLFAALIFAGCVYLNDVKPLTPIGSQFENQTSNNTAQNPGQGQPSPETQNGSSMQDTPAPEPETGSSMGQSGSEAQLSLTSSAFSNNGAIPNKYSCNGGDVIPPLQFTGVPQNTQSLALIMDDPDAVPVVGFVYVHWVVFDIPAMATEIPEGMQIGILGSAGSGEKRYEGPCPPPGETHTYSFRLYALDNAPQLQEGATKQEVETAMQNHILAQAELKGTYGQ